MADCQGTCADTCNDTCSKTCSGKCTDACTGCTGCSGCTSCTGQCYGTCVQECSESCRLKCAGNCYNECTSDCKNYCKSYCQTFCQKDQYYISNPKTAGGKFSWTYTVASGETIKITADEWNKLKGKIRGATSYCGGTYPSVSDVKKDDIITAVQYNSLANGLDLSQVNTDPNNKTIISAKLINDLSDTYNTRKISSNLPNGNAGSCNNQCCQKGQSCPNGGQAACHEVCMNQNASRPGH